MDIAALVISILALVAATAAAVYTRAQAVTADRGVKLSSEGQPVLEKTHAAAISVAGQPRIGGAALVGIRNHGKSAALQVALTDPTGKKHAVGTIKPDQLVPVRIAPDMRTRYLVTWRTVDQIKRSRRMRIL